MKVRIAGAAFVVIGLLLSGCGGSPTSGNSGSGAGAGHAEEVYGEINGLSGEQRTQKLTEMAKQEGALSLYTSNTDMDDIVKAFQDSSGIKVNTYRANSETVLQRILQESSASYQGADIVETNAGELNALNQQKLLAPYEGALRDAVRPEGQKENWTADRLNAFVIGWNTDKVPAGAEPHSLKDFADPAWKGRVSLELGDVDWFAAMYKYYQSQGMTDGEITDLFNRIAANAKIAKGHTVTGELLSAGQFDVAASIYSHTVENAAADGAPVGWRHADGKPVQPVVVRPNGAGLLKTAKNPAAAMLFMDFLLTDGQKQIAKANRIGSVPTENDPLAGVETVAPPEEELLNDSRKWNDMYEKIVQGGEKAS